MRLVGNPDVWPRDYNMPAPSTRDLRCSRLTGKGESEISKHAHHSLVVQIGSTRCKRLTQNDGTTEKNDGVW
jgi:hypothetical protein